MSSCSSVRLRGIGHSACTPPCVEHDRPVREPRHVAEARLVQVRDVDHHAELVAGADELAARRREAGTRVRRPREAERHAVAERVRAAPDDPERAQSALVPTPRGCRVRARPAPPPRSGGSRRSPRRRDSAPARRPSGRGRDPARRSTPARRRRARRARTAAAAPSAPRSPRRCARRARADRAGLRPRPGRRRRRSRRRFRPRASAAGPGSPRRRARAASGRSARRAAARRCARRRPGSRELAGEQRVHRPVDAPSEPRVPVRTTAARPPAGTRPSPRRGATRRCRRRRAAGRGPRRRRAPTRRSAGRRRW